MLTYLSAPLGASIEITKECNLNCIYCFQGNSHNGTELSASEILHLIDDLSDMKVFTLFFGGGEPLICKDFFQFAEYASKKGLEIGFSTNATLINKAIAEKIAYKGLGRGLQVSVDGSCSKIHDALRGKGAFEKCLQGIRNLVKCGVHPSIAVTITTYNISDIPNIIEFAQKEKIRHVHIMCLLPAGFAKPIFEELDPIIDEWKQLEKILVQLATKVENKLTIDCGNRCYEPPTPTFSEKDYSVIDKTFGGCPAGKAKAVIDCFGNVYGCDVLKDKTFCAGNIRQKSFKDIWNHSEAFKKWRRHIASNIKGKCSKCKWLFACGGGCPAITLYYGNDFFSSDPSCPHKIQ